jgi:hypothetical protein
MKHAAAVSLALACAGPEAAQAARPMITDDARLAEAHACQLDSWVRRNEGSTEWWAMPACNPSGGWELGFGAARTRARGTSRFTDALVQVKTLLRALDDNAWGLGLAAGTARHPAHERDNGWPGDPFVNVPLSIAVRPETWFAHFNAGAVRERDSGRTLATWAFGNEVRLGDATYVTAEVFGSGRGRASGQAGFRYWLLRDRIQLDGSVGTRAGAAANDRWFTLGVHIQFPAFMR